jgi:hypothetical protein
MIFECIFFSPISIAIAINMALFIFAAVKLYQMQSRVRSGKRRSGISGRSGTDAKRQSAGRSSGDASEVEDERKKRFIRQMSTVSTKFAQKNMVNLEALREK